MAMESYPQMILGVFIIMELQILQPLNFFSCTISTASVIYGFGDMLAFDASDVNAGAPFSQTVKGKGIYNRLAQIIHPES